MYTFAPLADIPVDHIGFALVVFTVLLCTVISIINEDDNRGVVTLICTLAGGFVILLAYCVSYVWTDQMPQTYANTPVEATFVKFVAEGEATLQSSGKTSRWVDHHYTYVVYSVNGEGVMLRGELGVTYPAAAILYKN